MGVLNLDRMPHKPKIVPTYIQSTGIAYMYVHTAYLHMHTDIGRYSHVLVYCMLEYAHKQWNTLCVYNQHHTVHT